LCTIVTTFYYSDIASMRRDGVATLYGSVQFQLKSVPALNYHAKDPIYPKWVVWLIYKNDACCVHVHTYVRTVCTDCCTWLLCLMYGCTYMWD